MDDEKFISGYCRRTDRSRMVAVELENGAVVKTDCDYGSCPYQTNCPIAKEIAAINT